MEDRIKIDRILHTAFFFRIAKILVFVLSCSYFFAMGFKMLTDIQNDIMKWGEYSKIDKTWENSEKNQVDNEGQQSKMENIEHFYFTEKFGLDEMS